MFFSEWKSVGICINRLHYYFFKLRILHLQIYIWISGILLLICLFPRFNLIIVEVEIKDNPQFSFNAVNALIKLNGKTLTCSAGVKPDQVGCFTFSTTVFFYFFRKSNLLKMYKKILQVFFHMNKIQGWLVNWCNQIFSVGHPWKYRSVDFFAQWF